MTGVVYAAVLENNGYIVGDANARSGLYYSNGDTGWQRLGWSNIRAFGLHIGETRFLMAAGNGLLASHDDGSSWRVTTGWRITEVLDVDVCPEDSSLVLIATAHGLCISKDGCSTWGLVSIPDVWRFTQCVRFDATNPRIALAAAEAGILRTKDFGSSWELTFSRATRCIRQNPTRPGEWWSVTVDGAILLSTDNGMRWTPQGPPHSRPLYHILAHDDLVLATGYLCGALVSRDNGNSWKQIQFPKSGLSGHAGVLTPGASDTVLIGTTTDGLFELDLGSESWRGAGLPDATIRGLYVA